MIDDIKLNRYRLVSLKLSRLLWDYSSKLNKLVTFKENKKFSFMFDA
jgi:hypothetical protein